MIRFHGNGSKGGYPSSKKLPRLLLPYFNSLTTQSGKASIYRNESSLIIVITIGSSQKAKVVLQARAWENIGVICLTTAHLQTTRSRERSRASQQSSVTAYMANSTLHSCVDHILHCVPSTLVYRYARLRSSLGCVVFASSTHS